MKKALAFLFIGLMAFGASVKAMASARIDSMSTDVREVEDIDLIWLYPNKVLEYKNTADFRLNPGLGNAFGGGTAEWGGVIAEEMSLGGVVGAYVNRPNFALTTASGLIGVINNFRNPARYYFTAPGGTTANATPNIVDIFWAKDLSGTGLGIHVNYGDSGIAAIQSEDLGLDLGLGFTGAGPFSELN